VRISGEAADIRAADRVVLPARAPCPTACAACANRACRRPCSKRRTKPLFGVCVGEQMLFDHSEEGDTPGLGLLPGKVCASSSKASAGRRLAFKVPQMGWNQVHQTSAHPLWGGLPTALLLLRAQLLCRRPKRADRWADSLWRTSPVPWPAIIFCDPVPPGKSAAAGLQLYRNFVHWKP
jgi:glutamine amidotransferase